MRQNWKKIGFASSLKPMGNFKKYQPKQQRSQSGNKSIKSLNKSRSYQKIKHSIQARGSSKPTSQQSSFRQVDLSYQTRPASIISRQKSNTSILQQEKVKQQYRSPYFNFNILLHKVLNYTDDLKDQLISLRKYVQNRDKQLMLHFMNLKEQSNKIIQSVSLEVIKQKNALKIALSKINELNVQNINLNKKIVTLSRQKQILKYQKQSQQFQNSIHLIPNYNGTMLKVSSESVNSDKQTINDTMTRSTSAYELKGLNQMQMTLRRLKRIFIENNNNE